MPPLTSISSWEESKYENKLEEKRKKEKEVRCEDTFGKIISDGDYVDVQNVGSHKVYKKNDSQLYFRPYGKEERVSMYFSNDLILVGDEYIENIFDKYKIVSILNLNNT